MLCCCIEFLWVLLIWFLVRSSVAFIVWLLGFALWHYWRYYPCIPKIFFLLVLWPALQRQQGLFAQFLLQSYAQSDTVNQDLYLWTINHSRHTVWGHVPQVSQWHDVPCLWGLRCGYLRLMTCCIHYMPGSHALWKVMDFFDIIPVAGNS